MFVTWRVDRNLTLSLLQCTQHDDQSKLIQDGFLLSQAYPGSDETNVARRDIIVELVSGLLAFSKRSNFDAKQTSTLLAIVMETHRVVCDEAAIVLSVSAAFAYFEKLLLKHCVQRPPFSIAVFDFIQMKAICEYMMDTYFCFFQMYQRVFGINMKLELISGNSTCAEVINVSVPPLSQGTDPDPPMEDYEAILQSKLEDIANLEQESAASASKDDLKLLSDSLEKIQLEARASMQLHRSEYERRVAALHGF